MNSSAVVLTTSAPLSRRRSTWSPAVIRAAISMLGLSSVVTPVLPISSMNICGDSFCVACRGAPSSPRVARRERFLRAIELSGSISSAFW